MATSTISFLLFRSSSKDLSLPHPLLLPSLNVYVHHSITVLFCVDLYSQSLSLQKLESLKQESLKDQYQERPEWKEGLATDAETFVSLVLSSSLLSLVLVLIISSSSNTSCRYNAGVCVCSLPSNILRSIYIQAEKVSKKGEPEEEKV